jgi:hypothetical protein
VTPAPAWQRARAWLPWLVAAGILGTLALRLPRAQLLHALGAGPVAGVALCSTAVVAASLLADAWATLSAFAVTGVRCPWRGLLLARGATYLLGLLNTVAGQGGMGVYLHRAGVAPLRALGTVLFLVATQVGALAVVAAAGMAAQLAGGGGGSGALAGWLPPLAALAAALALAFAALARRPAWLIRREVLRPAFAAGAGGFARAAGARLPQMLVMILGLWLGLRLWGIELPFGRGLVVIAVAVLVTVLPIAPSGIGTLELAVVTLAAPYAPAAAAAVQRANVLAFTLVYHLFSIATQALLGLLCLALLARRGGGEPCAVAPLAPLTPLAPAGRASP